MAYWTKCQHCGQWAVSAAPLAVIRDKSCPYCGNELKQENEVKEQQANKPKEESK